MGRPEKPRPIIRERGMNDFFRFYYRSLGTPLPLPEKAKLRIKYNSIVTGYFRFLFNKLVDGFDVCLSRQLSLGILSVKGKKLDFSDIDKLPIDWPNTYKLWNKNPEAKERKEYVRLTNEHSGMIRYRVVWTKMFSKLNNKYYYAFDPARHFKRALAKSIKNGKEYFVIEQ